MSTSKGKKSEKFCRLPSDQSLKFIKQNNSTHGLIKLLKLQPTQGQVRQNMEGELNNLMLVWISAAASLCYCSAATKLVPAGPARLLCFLPVICLFLALPLRLTTLTLTSLTSFFLALLANFKLLLLAFGKGPLGSDPPLTLPLFLSIACFPIKIQSPPRKSEEVVAKRVLYCSTPSEYSMFESALHNHVIVFAQPRPPPPKHVHFCELNLVILICCEIWG